jgi:hypothetical protein
MRTFVVEDFCEFVETGLLLQEVGRGWLGGFFFQREMHAFVTPGFCEHPNLSARASRSG